MTVHCKQENCIENCRAVASRVQGDFEEEARKEFSVSFGVCASQMDIRVVDKDFAQFSLLIYNYDDDGALGAFAFRLFTLNWIKSTQESLFKKVLRSLR
jgi:hypothetical protein